MAHTVKNEYTNLEVGTGDNPNTIPAYTTLALQKETGTVPYYVMRIDWDDDEKKYIRQQIEEALKKYYTKNKTDGEHDFEGLPIIDSGALDAIMETQSGVWLALMHTIMPSLVMCADPFKEYGYKPITPDHLKAIQGNG